MWSPRSAAEIEKAAAANTLPSESAAFEAKAQLPESKANSDIAVDVAAMATDGGVIIYGLVEDKATLTFTPNPIELQGVHERIDQVVQSNLRERVDLDIRPLALDSDPSRGYVVVDVPASPRAPHMVEAKGQHRFYGRGPAGNVILTEAQVSQLYERRRRAEAEALEALDRAIAAAPKVPTEDGRTLLHVVFHPLVSDRGLRQRVWPQDETAQLRDAITSARNAFEWNQRWSPELSDVLRDGRTAATVEGLAVTNRPFEVHGGGLTYDYAAQVEVLDDGTVRYFCAGAGELDGSGKWLRDPAVAQLVAGVALLAGRILDHGGYHGMVHGAVAVLGARGAPSRQWLQGNYIVRAYEDLPSVPTDDFRDSLQVSAATLLSDPTEVARRLTIRLLRTIRPDGFPDPLLAF